jgi:hypothetical protein
VASLRDRKRVFVDLAPGSEPAPRGSRHSGGADTE